MNPLIFPTIGSTVPLLFFWKGGFGIKLPMKADMPLNKETKPKSIETEVEMINEWNVYFLKKTPIEWVFNWLKHLETYLLTCLKVAWCCFFKCLPWILILHLRGIFSWTNNKIVARSSDLEEYGRCCICTI